MPPNVPNDPSIDDIKPFFVPWLAERDPDVGGNLDDMFETVRADGALSAKTKTLLVMVLDAARAHGKGVEFNAEIARKQGATEEEILEALEVATIVCGLQGLSTGSHAFDLRGD